MQPAASVSKTKATVFEAQTANVDLALYSSRPFAFTKLNSAAKREMKSMFTVPEVPLTTAAGPLVSEDEKSSPLLSVKVEEPEVEASALPSLDTETNWLVKAPALVSCSVKFWAKAVAKSQKSVKIMMKE